LAGLAVGFWANVDELKQQWQVDHVFQRAQDAKVVQGSRKNWARAVRAVNHWAEDEVDV
jgi:glycerol kinase